MTGCEAASFSFPAWTRREFLRAVTISAGAILTGCGHSAPTGQTVLTQWYHQYGETGTHDAVLRYAQQYTALNPHIQIQVVWVPGDYATKLGTSLLTGQGPDIFEMSSMTPAMVSAGEIEPLDDLFPPAVRQDFAPRDLAENTVGGKLYGVKMVEDTGVLFYRPSLLQAAGLTPPATMDALIAAAQKLTTPARKGLFAGNDGGISALMMILPWSAGSDFLVNNQIVFDNPRTVLAYEKLRQLNQSGALLMGAPTDYWDPSAFTQGLTAMQYSGLWAYPAIHKALGDDVGGMAWPALDAQGQPATFSGGWSEFINAQSPNIAEAKRFVQWLWINNTADQRDWNLGYGFHVPPRMSVARTAAALRAPLPAEAVKNLNAYGHYTPPAWNTAMGAALTDAVTNIVKFGDSAAAQVQTAAQTCKRELSRLLE